MNSTGRRGQIAIDRIVAIRSSVFPFYLIIQQDGLVTTADEVSDDGNDFLTTRMYGDEISFQSISGLYLSAEGGQIGTRRYCRADERFTVEKQDSQYAFRARCGKYLSIVEREPYVVLADDPTDSEVFQLFSLLMYNINVGQQLEILERQGIVAIDQLLSEEELEALRKTLEEGDSRQQLGARSHERRQSGLALASKGFASLSGHPVVVQLARRSVSASAKLSDVQSCWTDADFVRKELEAIAWHVAHPYSEVVEYPGIVDPRVSLTATWFINDLNTSNSTWAYAKAPLADGMTSPMLPHLSSPEEVKAVAASAQSLLGKPGSLIVFLGPHWMSNMIGAASFWKDYDAQTRYKHMSGQSQQHTGSFRALTNAQSTSAPQEELCPTLVQATYVREFVAPQAMAPDAGAIAATASSDAERQALERLLLPRGFA